MNNEIWKKWIPLNEITNRCSIETIIDDLNGFKIILLEEEKNKFVEIFFYNSVDSFRWADETYRIEVISHMNEAFGSKFYSKWSFFKVDESEYLNWLSEQSCGISNERELIHFAIIDRYSILDIIAPYEPKIEIVDKQ